MNSVMMRPSADALEALMMRCLHARCHIAAYGENAALFRWTDAVDGLGKGLAELGDADAALATRLEGELVVCGFHDARCAARVKPVLARLCSPFAAESPATKRRAHSGSRCARRSRPRRQRGA